MPIDPDVLARSVARLEGVDPVDTGLDAALERVVAETDDVFAVDGAGLLLLDEAGVLRYTAASDEPGRMLESLQEQFGEGPCVDAFLNDAPCWPPTWAPTRAGRRSARWPPGTGSAPSSASRSTCPRARSAPSTSTPPGRTAGRRPT